MYPKTLKEILDNVFLNEVVEKKRGVSIREIEEILKNEAKKWIIYLLEDENLAYPYCTECKIRWIKHFFDIKGE